MLFGTLSLNVLFYGIPRSNWFYLFQSTRKKGELYSLYLEVLAEKGYDAPTAPHCIEQSRLPELTENCILDEPTGNKSLLREQCIQAERSEYTRFSMLERGNASSYGRAFPFSLHGFRGMR